VYLTSRQQIFEVKQWEEKDLLQEEQEEKIEADDWPSA